MVYLSVYLACRVCLSGRRVSLVRRFLRRSSIHLNNSDQPFEQIDGLVRSQSVHVELFQDIDDDLGLGFSEEVRLRKRWLRDVRTGILAAKLGNDVVRVLLRAETLPFEQFHNRGDLLHSGDGDFFERYAVAAVVAYGVTLVYVEVCVRLDQSLLHATFHTV